MPRTVAIVQARMASTRLPGKVLMPIAGKPMLQWVVERINKSAEIDNIVIASTFNPLDDAIVDEAKKLGVACFRGSEEDVLLRYLEAAKKFNADFIVRICSDSPLIDSELIDETITAFKRAQPTIDFCCNHIPRQYPLGLDAQIFSLAALERANQLARKAYERSHVTIYMYEHPDQFEVHNVVPNVAFGEHRWTVDTPEDLEFVRQVYAHLIEKKPYFTWHDILSLLKQNPKLMELNEHVTKKATQLG